MKTDGGPAFPGSVSARPGEWAMGASGMSLRDYFAAMSLASLIVRFGADTAAELAYLVADTMLAERQKEVTPIPTLTAPPL